jgi:UDP-N-acetylmuramoyl-tripeptide--D-alanyl-D-alanine ligase
MAQCTKARVVTFGQSGADYLVSEVACPAPESLTLKVTHQGQTFELTSRLTGTHQSLAVAAAFACAHQLGVPPDTIRGRIASFEQVFGRCSVHRVEGGPVFIVDTAKAPYHSLQLAFEMLASFAAPRKRIVIGSISDTTGGSDGQRFQRVYRAACALADQVIFIGEHAHRAKAEDLAAERLVVKRSVQEAAAFLKKTSIPNEIILLKSSAGMHLERVMLAAVDTVRCWEDKCGRDYCVQLNGAGCGMYAFPFEQHKTSEQRKLLRLELAAGAPER